ncbi:MAG: AarF/ABC1/UbiB kinase family protein [Symploca sp. SIO2G7]|nr:AarF/ABC1/UbiB kinase family protein [Symploca sp. SIO2G7]
MRRLLSGSKTDEPELPPPAVLRNVLTDLGPVYVKLGQLLSTRPDILPPPYIEALSSLQTNVPPVRWSEVEVVIRQELQRPLEEIFTYINPEPVAAGSMAQVHKATLPDGHEIALKVQRPGIEVLVERDVALIKKVAKLVASTDVGKSYDVVGLAEEFSSALYAELDFTQEAGYTEQFGDNLAQSRWFDSKRLVVPKVEQKLTTKKLLALEWLEGLPLLSASIQGVEYGGSANAERQAITTVVFRAFFQQYLSDGLFHADPHPGNLFYLRDGRVAILDCGMMGFLDPRMRSVLTELLLAIVSVDAQRCTQLTLQLAEATRPVDLASLEADYRQLLRRYYNLSLSQLNTSEALYEVLQAARRNNLSWPGNIGLFAKSLANLEGVGRQFYPGVNVLEEVRPLMSDIFQEQLFGSNPRQDLLRTAVEFRNLSLESPRQFAFLLNRLSNETLQLNIKVQGLDALRRSINDAANRRSFSTVLGALIIGAAILSTGAPTAQVHWLSDTLFIAASLLGLWLIFSILTSGRFK